MESYHKNTRFDSCW